MAVLHLAAHRALDELLKHHEATALHTERERADLLDRRLWGKLLAGVLQLGGGRGHLYLNPLGRSLALALGTLVFDFD